MSEFFDYGTASRIVREATGVVIPVYLPPTVDVVCGERLLADTVRAYCEVLGEPQRICLSVDGAASATEAVVRLCKETGVQKFVAGENGGKLRAVNLGVRVLLEAEQKLRYIAIVDQDGDHFANELVNLVRCALHVTSTAGTERVLVIGRRASLHRPMGFLRGELEEWIDRVLLDTLQYHAAVTGQPLSLEYVAPWGEYPDFQSGFKLFSRATAHDVVCSEPATAGLSPQAYYRHAVETVLTVESVLHGACLAMVNRSTIDTQPVSTFGNFERTVLFADKLLWSFKRLDIPAAFAAQWMANHASRLLLNTLQPQGREEIDGIARRVLAGLGADPGQWRLVRTFCV